MLTVLVLLMSILLVSPLSAPEPSRVDLSFKPNPFAASVDVSFYLADGGEDLVLGVYDVNNRQRTRIDLGDMEPGEHLVVISTSQWRNGVYVFVLTGGDGRLASGSAMKLGIEPARNDSVAVFPF